MVIIKKKIYIHCESFKKFFLPLIALTSSTYLNADTLTTGTTSGDRHQNITYLMLKH